ncbi:hypothetical protein BLOT_002896 [Blomia tropicalis]|nr:hypothetical protein BLOT_002896 [Blomia tropicalis]
MTKIGKKTKLFNQIFIIAILRTQSASRIVSCRIVLTPTVAATVMNQWHIRIDSDAASAFDCIRQFWSAFYFYILWSGLACFRNRNTKNCSSSMVIEHEPNPKKHLPHHKYLETLQRECPFSNGISIFCLWFSVTASYVMMAFCGLIFQSNAHKYKTVGSCLSSVYPAPKTKKRRPSHVCICHFSFNVSFAVFAGNEQKKETIESIDSSWCLNWHFTQLARHLSACFHCDLLIYLNQSVCFSPFCIFEDWRIKHIVSSFLVQTIHSFHCVVAVITLHFSSYTVFSADA